MDNGYGAKTKARFYYNGEEYADISVTDPKYFGSGIFLESVYLVLSIGSVLHDKYYKWIAAIYDTNSVESKQDNFEIDERLLSCLKVEFTDELNQLPEKVIDLEAIKALDMDPDDKIDNMGAWYTELMEEEEKLKNQINRLTILKRSVQNKAKTLKKALEEYLAGEAFDGSIVKIYYTKSKVVDFEEGCNLKDVDQRFWRISEPELNKKEVGDILKNGGTVDGCRLIEKENMKIKIKK